MSIFNIKKQYDNLVARANQLEARAHILAPQEAYYCYLNATQSVFRKVLSFIPLTKGYNCRVACAKAFKEADKNLDYIRDYRASLANAQAVAVCLQRSKSAEHVEMPKHYDSPINKKERTKTLPTPSPEAMLKQLRNPWQNGARVQ